MARVNQRPANTAKAKAIAAKENSRAMAMHALLITATILCGLFALTHLAN